MNQIPVLNFQDFIAADGDELTTDSRKVAAVHGKRHDDMLRLIRKRIAEAGEWGLRNFAEGVYFDQRNQQNHPMFTMTKDGYQFLVGKMTGKKAVTDSLGADMPTHCLFCRRDIATPLYIDGKPFLKHVRGRNELRRLEACDRELADINVIRAPR